MKYIYAGDINLTLLVLNSEYTTSAADNLVTWGARPSEAMVLTMRVTYRPLPYTRNGPHYPRHLVLKN